MSAFFFCPLETRNTSPALLYTPCTLHPPPSRPVTRHWPNPGAEALAVADAGPRGNEDLFLPLCLDHLSLSYITDSCRPVNSLAATESQELLVGSLWGGGYRTNAPLLEGGVKLAGALTQRVHSALPVRGILAFPL